MATLVKQQFVVAVRVLDVRRQWRSPGHSFHVTSVKVANSNADKTSILQFVVRDGVTLKSIGNIPRAQSNTNVCYLSPQIQ